MTAHRTARHGPRLATSSTHPAQPLYVGLVSTLQALMPSSLQPHLLRDPIHHRPCRLPPHPHTLPPPILTHPTPAQSTAASQRRINPPAKNVSPHCCLGLVQACTTTLHHVQGSSSTVAPLAREVGTCTQSWDACLGCVYEATSSTDNAWPRKIVNTLEAEPWLSPRSVHVHGVICNHVVQQAQCAQIMHS